MRRLLMALLVGMLILNACSKDDSRPWDENQSKPVTADNLVAQSNFDWKTTKKYQLTLKGTLNNMVKISSANGIVYQKVFLQAGTDCITIITVPAYENSVHLVNSTKDIELALSGPTLTYSF